MNDYMTAQIANMAAFAKNFKTACRLAALKNDGTIDRHEEKIIAAIDRATDRYLRELEKIGKM